MNGEKENSIGLAGVLASGTLNILLLWYGMHFPHITIDRITSSAALISRQFVDMSHIRIEGYLAAFPKLVGTGKQHTYVETENVRYVYQPIESLYLLLVTNKQSNILEDLETLRLLSKLVSFMFF
ncbi:hypothetical protein MTR67_043096 [Solanum verrucosum]|uniref:Coatomer subunit delta n=1 Tax=Solanum verrucosum TaxID=315347 RepID=A0AAF0ZSD4_SOLVR|nr:hypothetical protein MTR67_043096 [Solanum verrucosum]